MTADDTCFDQARGFLSGDYGSHPRSPTVNFNTRMTATEIIGLITAC